MDCDRIITMCSPVLLTIHQFIHDVPQKQLFVKSKESVVCVWLPVFTATVLLSATGQFEL